MSTPEDVMLSTVGPDNDRGAGLAAVFFTGCIISLLVVILRFWARLSIKGVGSDDWCMLATWVAYLGFTILAGFSAFNGGTRHIAYLQENPKQLEYAIKLNWISQPFGIISLALGKWAVALLLVRLLGPTSFWRKWTLYMTTIWTMINAILMAIFTFVQCKDPRALWNSQVKAETTCWEPATQSNFSIYGSSQYALQDFLLALLPITIIYNLNMNWREKLLVCILLGCGSLAGIFAAIKTASLVSLNARSDITFETFHLYIYAGIECAVLIICGSVPTLKPIYNRIGKDKRSARKSQSAAYTGISRNIFPRSANDVYPLTSVGGSLDMQRSRTDEEIARRIPIQKTFNTSNDGATDSTGRLF